VYSDYHAQPFQAAVATASAPVHPFPPFPWQVEAQLAALQQQRAQQLAPSRLYLPIPWQPIIYEQPVTMFKASVWQTTAAQHKLGADVTEQRDLKQCCSCMHADMSPHKQAGNVLSCPSRRHNSAANQHML
jgi:hypothetical protein